MNTRAAQTNQLPKRKRVSSQSNVRRRTDSVQWLFQSNIPRRRSQALPDIHKREFFGMGEIVGVLANPAETVRSLTESRRLLEDARREINQNRERSQLRTKHTFSRLPGFFARQAEIGAIQRALEGEPSFTVLFGASSVGKTALLREVLSRDRYHVLHFDLRIAGFADLASLYLSLSQQMEQYFEEVAKQMPGYEEFEKEAWSFKHDRINVEQRISGMPDTTGKVKTSDIARLMELFQSSLLKYWEFDPGETASESSKSQESKPRRQETESASDHTHVENGEPKPKRKFSLFRKSKGKDAVREPRPSESETVQATTQSEEKPKPFKKMPVIFFDEAHKLPALIQSTEAMKCILDSMLVLTKQDRLCHVIHATSDPFYQTWLRQLNVMQHCKIITIGDCSKQETRAFFQERLLPRVPIRLRMALDFEALYDAFGGKLAHWHDYITDYINSNGKFEIKRSSHFLQAHALLNLHIIHSSQSAPPGNEGEETGRHSAETLHPNIGAAGFKIYSPITHPHGPSTSSQAGHGDAEDRGNQMVAGHYAAEFSAMQLLKVMSRLSQPDIAYLPYFLLCREIGVRAVDGMVKGRVLDLRWTETVTKEGVDVVRERSRTHSHAADGSSATAVNHVTEEGEDISPVSAIESPVPEYEEEVEDVVGPKLVPTTPVMRYAMREVVQEYEDEQSISEYASLSDVDEY